MGNSHCISTLLEHSVVLILRVLTAPCVAILCLLVTRLAFLVYFTHLKSVSSHFLTNISHEMVRGLVGGVQSLTSVACLWFPLLLLPHASSRTVVHLILSSNKQICIVLSRGRCCRDTGLDTTYGWHIGILWQG